MTGVHINRTCYTIEVWNIGRHYNVTRTFIEVYIQIDAVEERQVDTEVVLLVLFPSKFTV